MKTEIEIVPYGGISTALTKDRWQTIGHHARLSKSLRKSTESFQRFVVTFSHDLDDSFVELFREKATPDTRLLILNEGASTDRLLSRIFDLKIRKPERCYVVETKYGAGKSNAAALLIHSLLARLVLGFEANDKQERILDARAENGTLHVVSPNFDRLDVPISQIPQLRNAEPSQVGNFEIDEDGAFIYWPDFDLHLGWSQLHQIVNPAAACKVLQKSRLFNVRYGKAVQKVREAAGLKPSDIVGLSEKQLGRIEKGECRLTSNGIDALSKAHGLKANEYLQKLAEALTT